MAVCVFINIEKLTWEEPGIAIQSGTCLFFVIPVLFGPAFVAYFLWRNYEKIKNGDEELEEVAGGFYDGRGVRPTMTKGELIWYSLWFMFRRLELAAVVVFSRNYLFWQIGTVIFCSLIAVIIIGTT
jgi:hypothetical protein